MSFFGVGNPFSTPVGQKIEQATDGTLPSENWGLNMEICDIINSTVDGPKDAMKAIRKRLTQSAGKNYKIVMYTLTVLETCVKNCGKQLHLLVCNKEFISELVKLIGPKNDPPAAVQEKVLSLIQCWADAFNTQPELQGVVLIYNELRTKGVEFPMTDLDTMAPIFTPQRSVPDGPEPVLPMSPQRGTNGPPAQTEEAAATATVVLSASQTNKLRSDLAVVEGNMTVMNEMLNEMTSQPPDTHHQSDIELLNELATTVRSMQVRVAELVLRLAADAPLTNELLHANDLLHNLLLRHQRFLGNRGVRGTAAAPSAILGEAMGVPTAQEPRKEAEDDALIDLSDDVPDIAKLSVKDTQPNKSPSGSSKDEFDMFAQSRNLTYDTAKAGSSSYADNIEEQSNAGLATAVSQRPTQGLPPTGIDEREIDEIQAWLNQEKQATSEATAGQDSVTSSDFDKFLAERAAVAETLPTQTNNEQPTPRHRQIKKEEQDPMFAL